LKEGELLNTELIFALIRLGIKDSKKFQLFGIRYPQFCSQLKNKAAGPREDFEANVMQLEPITKRKYCFFQEVFAIKRSVPLFYYKSTTFLNTKFT
jgi:hypothetical protein